MRLVGYNKRIRINSRSGLTIIIAGSIAVGKTYIATYMQKHGFYYISTDKIAHHVINTKARKCILSAFANYDITDNNGNIDRRKLANVVFSSFPKLRLLESLVHPSVLALRAAMVDKIKKNSKRTIVIETPLFFSVAESALKDFDIVVEVVSSNQVQYERAIQRKHMTKELFDAMLMSRISSGTAEVSGVLEVGKGCYKIDTSGSRLFVRKTVRSLMGENGRFKAFKRNCIRYRNNGIKYQRKTQDYRDRMRRIDQ